MSGAISRTAVDQRPTTSAAAPAAIPLRKPRRGVPESTCDMTSSDLKKAGQDNGGCRRSYTGRRTREGAAGSSRRQPLTASLSRPSGHSREDVLLRKLAVGVGCATRVPQFPALNHTRRQDVAFDRFDAPMEYGVARRRRTVANGRRSGRAGAGRAEDGCGVHGADQEIPLRSAHLDRARRSPSGVGHGADAPQVPRPHRWRAGHSGPRGRHASLPGSGRQGRAEAREVLEDRQDRGGARHGRCSRSPTRRRSPTSTSTRAT